MCKCIQQIARTNNEWTKFKINEQFTENCKLEWVHFLNDLQQFASF